MSIFLVAAISVAAAQSPAPVQRPVWQMQESGTTAGLRGIDSVDGTVAWASGNGGAVLKTTDGGQHWQHCAIPDGDKDGATLDFRGVQAWDAQTAIVMASGHGDKSRVYKTTDGCKTWMLILKNKDREGFWDALRITGPKTALMVGDPLPKKELDCFKVKVFFHFPLYGTSDAGQNWGRLDSNTLFATSDAKNKPTQSIFAASNSSLLEMENHSLILFATGGERVSLGLLQIEDHPVPMLCKKLCSMSSSVNVPLRSGPSAGGFSVAVRDVNDKEPKLVVVGGDYSLPAERAGTAAACSKDQSAPTFAMKFRCAASAEPPHGYRSAVQWSESLKLWITAGTNGSDISRDDGKTWQPLDNGNWNALSLPFIVGPDGLIARLNPQALPKP
jgi:hypothetical protein